MSTPQQDATIEVIKSMVEATLVELGNELLKYEHRFELEDRYTLGDLVANVRYHADRLEVWAKALEAVK
jgi:hypothetical protein